MTNLLRISFLVVVALLLAVAAVFTVSESFPDALVDAKWHASLWMALLMSMVVSACSLCGWRVRLSATLEGAVGAVCLAQAVFFLAQRFCGVGGYGEYACGSFDNVAGFASCLAIGFPMGWRAVKVWPGTLRWAFFLAKGISALALALCGSRTGVLCLLVWGLWHFSPRRRGRNCMALALLVFLALFVKGDSTLGRWFLLCRSVEMFLVHPLLGWGAGGFAAHYMDVQAGFFASHPHGGYALLADNVLHPLNEFVLVAVEHGLVGLCLVLSLLALALWQACRHPTPESALGKELLLVVATFSFFSYPFHYPFAWLATGLALWLVFAPLVRWRAKACACLSMLAALCLSFPLHRATCLVREWGEIQAKAAYGLSERMLPRYAALYPAMKGNPRFLYGYAVELYESGRFLDASRVAGECDALLADYDLCLLRGYVCQGLGHDGEALSHFRHAHFMCPSRITPLFEAYRIYRKEGREDACRRLRDMAAAMPLKVKSRQAMDMLWEMGVQ